MHNHHQDILLFRDSDQRDPQQWTLREIERLSNDVLRFFHRPCFAL